MDLEDNNNNCRRYPRYQCYKSIVIIVNLVIAIMIISATFTLSDTLSIDNSARSSSSSSINQVNSNTNNSTVNNQLLLPTHLKNTTADTNIGTSSSSLQAVSKQQEINNKQPTTTASVNDVQSNDVFISVKTTKRFHKKRLNTVLATWFRHAIDNTYFFTDANDDYYIRHTNNHMINTGCSATHSRSALSCKMGYEFSYFINNSNKSWFCHFDDDNYVNVKQLYQLLTNYDPTQDLYLGKPSIRAPLELKLDTPSSWPAKNDNNQQQQQEARFSFGTGGAGFCLSRSLANKMIPYAR